MFCVPKHSNGLNDELVKSAWDSQLQQPDGNWTNWNLLEGLHPLRMCAGYLLGANKALWGRLSVPLLRKRGQWRQFDEFGVEETSHDRDLKCIKRVFLFFFLHRVFVIWCASLVQHPSDPFPFGFITNVHENPHRHDLKLLKTLYFFHKPRLKVMHIEVVCLFSALYSRRCLKASVQIPGPTDLQTLMSELRTIMKQQEKKTVIGCKESKEKPELIRFRIWCSAKFTNSRERQ